MTRRGVALGLALASLRFVCACSTVSVPKPVGELIGELDPEEWTGTWMATDGTVVFVRGVEGEFGHFRASWLEGDGVRTQIDAVLRTSGGRTLWNTTELEPDETPPRYIWGRLERKGDTVLMWSPDLDKVAALVQRGLLPGEVVSSYTVKLGELEPRHLGLFTSEEQGVLFNWASPVVLRRISE